MINFSKIAENIPVAAVLTQLFAAPQLWDQFLERTKCPDSPHADSSDIWVRFRPRAELVESRNFDEPHLSVFYPAWYHLPAFRPIVFGLMATVQAVHLGGILITRIPPGKSILPHVDKGWHAEYMNTKAYVILQANERCINKCGDEEVVMRPGEAWLFNNLIEHSVFYGGEEDRIAAVITMRIE